jgi:hypothetical protein
MEASEKPQLPLDGGDQDAPAGVVRLLEDRLVIEELTVNDERAARFVRERAESGQPPPRTVADAIEIGARVLEREGSAAEADYVRREFERVSAEARQQLVEQARGVIDSIEGQFEKAFGEEGGALGRVLEGFEGELSEQIAEQFDVDRAGAVPNQVKEIVSKVVEERMQGLVRHLSSEDGSNPLADFKSGVNRTVVEAVRHLKAEEKATREKLEQLQQEVVRLTEQAEARRRLAEAEDVGTRKGLSFEERVHAALDRIAAARGDAASHTGGEQAEGGGKKGDTLIELGACDGPSGGRILFEAKDKKLSKNEAWNELNQGMHARAAAFAVLVVAGEDRIPANRQALHEYEGNKVIVAVDRERPDGLALEVAYRLAAARVLLARESELEVDPVAVRDTAAEAITLLKQAQAIRSTLTGIKTSSDKARASLDAMVAAVEEKLQRIDSLVSAGQPE